MWQLIKVGQRGRANGKMKSQASDIGAELCVGKREAHQIKLVAGKSLYFMIMDLPIYCLFPGADNALFLGCPILEVLH